MLSEVAEVREGLPHLISLGRSQAAQSGPGPQLLASVPFSLVVSIGSLIHWRFAECPVSARSSSRGSRAGIRGVAGLGWEFELPRRAVRGRPTGHPLGWAGEAAGRAGALKLWCAQESPRELES